MGTSQDRGGRVSKPSHLMKKVIGHNACGSGKIQAADIPPNGYEIAGVCFSDMVRQTGCFPAEQEIIPMPDLCRWIGGRCVPTQDEKPCFAVHRIKECLKIPVMTHIDLLPVIQAGPLEMLVINLEPQGMDQVQPHFSGPAETGNISGVGRNFRLVKDNVQRGVIQYPMTDLCNIACHAQTLGGKYKNVRKNKGMLSLFRFLHSIGFYPATPRERFSFPP